MSFVVDESLVSESLTILPWRKGEEVLRRLSTRKPGFPQYWCPRNKTRQHTYSKMIMEMGKELKADLEVLKTLDGEAFEQVAAIAAAQLHSGAPGGKAIKTAAATLNLGAEELAAALEALSFVITESARQQLPEQELRTALQEQLPLSEAAIESLVRVSLAEIPHARRVAEDFGHPLPAFRSLEWRLDVQVRSPCCYSCCRCAQRDGPASHARVAVQMGSRCLRGQATPKMTIKLDTDKAGQSITHFLQVCSPPCYLALFPVHRSSAGTPTVCLQSFPDSSSSSSLPIVCSSCVFCLTRFTVFTTTHPCPFSSIFLRTLL